MAQKQIVKLRVYKGKELNYTKDGVVKNENHLVSLEYGSTQWKIFLKNLSLLGYCKVGVEKAFDNLGKSEYKELKDLSAFTKEVNSALSIEKTTEATPDQKRIAELEATIKLMQEQISGSQAPASKPIDITVPDSITTEDTPLEEMSMEQLQAKYKEIVGTKAHHMKKEETLIEEIKAKL